MNVLLLGLTFLVAQTDTVFRVPKDTRVAVTLAAGSVIVNGWDRADVEIKAEPRGRTQVQSVLDGAVLRVSGRAATGVDYANIIINVPRAMSIKLATGDVDITVRDSEGELNILNYRGLIDVAGGRGAVLLKSTLGEIRLSGARGHIEAETTHENVTLIDVAGDVQAKSSSKHVTLNRVDTRNLDAETVAGVIRFTGPFHADGHYSFATHMGSIWATVTGDVDATVSVATVSGAFSSALPYRVTDRRRAGIYTAVFGEGKAQVEMESFAGAMVIR